MTYGDFDPNRGERRFSDPVLRDDDKSGMTMMGILAAIAIALVVGLVYFNMGESTDTASNTSPGVTTGSSPPSQPSPPAKSPDTPAKQ
jgi:hypothetical protein